MKLTAKQVRFVQEYLIEPNAKEAAIRAGYSAKTAAEIGHENLIKPHVAAEIEKARVKRAERCELSADWVVDELAHQGLKLGADRHRLSKSDPAARQGGEHIRQDPEYAGARGNNGLSPRRCGRGQRAAT